MQFYAMSVGILANRKSYYEILEQTQKGDLDISLWLKWFLKALNETFSQVLDIRSFRTNGQPKGRKSMIQTERLELRKFTQQDRDLMLPLLQNADFMAFSPTGAMTKEQAEVRFKQLVDAFPTKGIGKFCVIERSTGDLLGYCGIESFEYQGEDVVEHGYRLKVSARRNGYALEASNAVLSYAKEIGYTKIYAFTESSHTISQHILGKLGFKKCGMGEYQNMPVHYFDKDL